MDTRPHGKLLKLQTSTDEPTTSNQKSSQLIEREHVKGTAFWIIGNKEQGYFITFGQYRLTEPRSTKAACHKMIKERDYELIAGLIGACIEAHKQYDQFNEIKNHLNNGKPTSGITTTDTQVSNESIDHNISGETQATTRTGEEPTTKGSDLEQLSTIERRNEEYENQNR